MRRDGYRGVLKPAFAAGGAVARQMSLVAWALLPAASTIVSTPALKPWVGARHAAPLPPLQGVAARRVFPATRIPPPVLSFPLFPQPASRFSFLEAYACYTSPEVQTKAPVFLRRSSLA